MRRARLKGRTAVVTGATGGIGRFVALGLAQAGMQVVLVGRDEARGEAALRAVSAEAPGANLVFMRADLSSLAETAALGRRITCEHPAVAVLVNNAGVFRARPHATAEGLDEVLAVNVLSPFVLVRELEGVLRAGTPSRIVTVGSSTSDRARLDPARLGAGPVGVDGSWGLQRSYAQSKLAVTMATFAWAERLRGSGVTANVVHPGAVATGLVRSPGVIGLAWRLMRPWLRTERQGAETPLHAALAPERAGDTGLYFKDCAPVVPNPLARDAAACRLVWETVDRLTRGASGGQGLRP